MTSAPYVVPPLILLPILIRLALQVAHHMATVRKEIREHDVEAQVLRSDLNRWVAERDRLFTIEVRRIVNTAGNNLYSGSTVAKLYAAMRSALADFADHAVEIARAYQQLAQAEGWLHSTMRRYKSRLPEALLLDPKGDLALVGWRELTAPGDRIVAMSPEADPTYQPEVVEMHAILGAPGLTWRDARMSSAS